MSMMICGGCGKHVDTDFNEFKFEFEHPETKEIMEICIQCAEDIEGEFNK